VPPLSPYPPPPPPPKPSTPFVAGCETAFNNCDPFPPPPLPPLLDNLPIVAPPPPPAYVTEFPVILLIKPLTPFPAKIVLLELL
jgi:hypothetical protein